MRIVVTLTCLIITFPLQAQQKTNTNILIILADDLGWTDLSCYGSSFYETPNLDKLASRGIRFTQAYATAPVCSPTRASMMTGKYPLKTGVTDWIKGRQADGKATGYEKLIGPSTAYELSLSEKTIAEFALDHHYQTFFAGKWHLGEEEKYWPDQQGFQHNIGGWSKGSPYGRINDTTGGFFTPYSNPTIKDGPPGEYLTDRLTNECLQYLDTVGNKPFLLMYSLYAVHNPMQAPAALIKKYQAKQKKLGIDNKQRFSKDESWMQYENDWKNRLVQDNAVYAAMIENMDQNIGRLLEKLKEKNLDENTLIIFTSDNGGLSTAEGSPTTNKPLRGGKGWMYEGGIRVPMIMVWKNKLQAGKVEEMPVTIADLYPTIANTIDHNVEKNKEIDGANIFSLLSASKKDRKLYWHYPHYSNQGGGPASAIREGNFKLIYNYADESTELYDLSKDIEEKHNIAPSNQKTTAHLKTELMQWLRDNHAKFPAKNPNYDPSAKKKNITVRSNPE